MPKNKSKKIIIPKDEVAVLAITTHGDIQVYKNKETKTYEPNVMNRINDMEIISLNVVTPGVPNLSPPEEVEGNIKIIKDETKKFNNSTNKNTMIEIVENIKRRLIASDDQPQIVETETRKKNPNFTGDEEIVAYRLHDDAMYSIHDYSSEMPLNKEFFRANADILNKPPNERYDWRITLLSDDNEPDLINELNQTISSLRNADAKPGNSVTYLNNIIHYLRSRNKKKIIIIDFSCSVIRRKEFGLEPNEERYARLAALRNVLGGKNNITRNKKKPIKKTRKNRN
jgi:hypothetical protein